MKLSENTITTLKNFANINSSMWFKPGTKQRSIDINDFVAATATMEEFPKEFCIYDLNQFLSNISTLNDPDLVFQDNYLTMSDGKITLKYFYCSPMLLKEIPDDEIVIDNPDLTFRLDQDIYQKLIKLANMNNLTNLTFSANKGKLTCSVSDPKNSDAGNASYEIGDVDSDKKLSISFNIDNLLLLPNNYNVSISEGNFGLFEAKDGALQYLIASELPQKGTK